jgi:hypothetical protein
VRLLIFVGASFFCLALLDVYLLQAYSAYTLAVLRGWKQRADAKEGRLHEDLQRTSAISVRAILSLPL